MGLSPQRVLGLDTSTWRASVGIVEANQILAEHHQEVRGNHSVSLFPLIEQVLSAAALSIDDVQAVAVARGPGSFSGLRVSLSVAKGLALASDIPVIGVSTLEALARAAEREGVVCPLLDARKGEVYWAAFRIQGDDCERLLPDALGRPADAIRQLPPDSVVIGDATSAYSELVRQSLPQATILPFPEHGPRGGVVARLGYQQLQRGEAPSLAELEPVYIRPSEAELNLR